MSWIDLTLQQIFSCRLHLKMAAVLDREKDAADFQVELDSLLRIVNASMWNESSAFYFDRLREGNTSSVKSIAAFWALLADALPAEKLPRFIDHLRDPAEFNRPHRVPAISADTPQYSPMGSYWIGGVWPNTNYMVMRGLSHAEEHDLAREIAMSHHENVVKVFEDTGTVWENYAPESAAPGAPSKPDNVGWSGLGPVAVLFEYVFGLRPNIPQSELLWDVRLLEEHGVERYPFGRDGDAKPEVRGARSARGEAEDRGEGRCARENRDSLGNGQRNSEYFPRQPESRVSHLTPNNHRKGT